MVRQSSKKLFTRLLYRNSVNTVFALTTTLQINPFFGNNNAAILTTRPIDKASKGQLFIHNPGAYDPDGDSLVYKMDTCRYDNGQPIPGFALPPATDSIYVNPITGDLIWDTHLTLENTMLLCVLKNGVME